jgi:type II secretory pathway pseudopilin PulG
MRFNEQGRSMIEMLGVLAIVGVLSVGGIAGYSKAMNKFKTNKLIEQVNMISTNIRTLYASQRSYAGLTNGVAVRTGVLPNEMVDSNVSVTTPSTITSTGIINAFSGNVYITSAPAKDGDTDGAFIIAMDKIPEASCVSIATTEWGGDAGGGLLAMAIASSSNATDVSGDSSGLTLDSGSVYTIGANQLPVGVAQASVDCEGAENMIAWKYM